MLDFNTSKFGRLVVDWPVDYLRTSNNIFKRLTSVSCFSLYRIKLQSVYDIVYKKKI